jgi:hypothetical protein
MPAESERRRDDLAALRIDRSAPAAAPSGRAGWVAWIGGASVLFLLLVACSGARRSGASPR